MKPSKEASLVIEDFDNENPESNVYVLAGPAGSEEKELLLSIQNHYMSQANWICIALSSKKEGMIFELAFSLDQEAKQKGMFKDEEFPYSCRGIVEGNGLELDPLGFLEVLLQWLGEKVFVMVKDIVPSNTLILFLQAFQFLLSKGCPIYLVLTGSDDNVSALQKARGSSFFCRAARISL